MIKQIPYVIDNQAQKLADVLNSIMAAHAGASLDIATAYFSITGYRELRENLEKLRNFRLLLGFEPQVGKDVGLDPQRRSLAGAFKGDLEAAPFTEATLRLVEDLIAFLGREETAVRLYENGFLHAKAYLFYGDRGGQLSLFDRFLPLIGIVGSSNFTGPGLRTNRELNLAHKTLLDPEELDDPHARAAAERLGEARANEAISQVSRRILKSEVGARAILDLVDWYERQWAVARDFKSELIELLDESKFGRKEYTPYEVYLKAIYEYFRDDLGDDVAPGTRSAVELAEFQEDAVNKARRILAKYDGVMIADSVGMGKTWIGKKLLEDYAYHQRMKAVVVCPASLREMWRRELAGATIAAEVVSQEMLGQGNGNFDPQEYADTDVFLIDESHNFRNHDTRRYESLETAITGMRGRGRSGERKKVILLTATPVNNSIYDLYNQFVLFTGNDRQYFASAGIGDLKRYFDLANRQRNDRASTAALFNLLEEVVIRRTRPFIRAAYPSATILGEAVKWPERQLRTVRYDLEATYEGIYEKVVAGIDQLQLPHYDLEQYKKIESARDEFELGREEALVGIFKSRYLKRFESSVDAFRISIRRALSYIKTYEDYLLDGKLLDSRTFEKAARFLSSEDTEDDATPRSVSDELDASTEARTLLDELPQLNPTEYDLKRLHRALQHDVEILEAIWSEIGDITAERDAKLQKLKWLLGGVLRNQKVLLFTYYKDTARYLFRELGSDSPSAVEWRRRVDNPRIRRMDSGASPHDRISLIQAFSPRSNNKPEIAGTEREIQVLVSTDVLSEGQNLQDCGLLVNYDLHWNPTRMVQRAGRIDRIGSQYDEIWIYNMFPDEGLERLLKLVESLSAKIESINETGLLDASVLGEAVNPRNFNTLRRISEEDGSVIEEQERFSELASPEFLQQELRKLLESGAQSILEQLPDGIHSGRYKEGAKGLFFYFTAPDAKTGGRQHFWRYYDAATGQIADNRLVIADLIRCSPDTQRITGDLDVFEVQEKVITHILDSVKAQAAVEAAPRKLDPVQSTLRTWLQAQMNNPQLSRAEVKGVLEGLRRPAGRAQLKRLKDLYRRVELGGDPWVLLTDLKDTVGATIETEISPTAPNPQLRREELRLVCFEHIVS